MKAKGIVQFYVGLILSLGAAILTFFNWADEGVMIPILVIGIILIATSKYRLLK